MKTEREVLALRDLIAEWHDEESPVLPLDKRPLAAILWALNIVLDIPQEGRTVGLNRLSMMGRELMDTMLKARARDIE